MSELPLVTVSPAADIVKVDRIRIRLGEHVSPNIRLSIQAGEYEHGELHALQSLLAPEDVVMELGTGLGFLSAYCAQVVGSDNVFTFEANAALEPHIRDTFALNNVSPKLEISVLADRPGHHDFYVAEAFWESSLLPRINPSEVVKVPAKVANDELARINPTVLVIDIEGGEYDLLQHLNPVGVKKLVIELHPDEIGIERTVAVVAMLYGHGFKAIKAASSCNVLGLIRPDRSGSIPALAPAEAIDNLDWTKIRKTLEEINDLTGPSDGFILLDDHLFDTAAFGPRRRFYLPDGDGQYCGLPADDLSAVEELERLRREGAKLIVFAWPAFWWLVHYAGLSHHLRSNFRLICESDRMVVFDLNKNRE